MADIIRLHSLWDELCQAAGGSDSSTAAHAVATAGQVGLLEPLSQVLANLGYPGAMRSAKGLGAALRNLQGREGEDGATLRRRPRRGGAVWHVARSVGGTRAAWGERAADVLDGLAEVGRTAPRREDGRVFDVLTSVEGGPTAAELFAALAWTLENDEGAAGEVVAALKAGARALRAGAVRAAVPVAAPGTGPWPEGVPKRWPPCDG